MSVAAIVFSNLHDQYVPELTSLRTMASVPFGGRYRLIDFTLSNLVNSGITDIRVITYYNYQSLMDHIGSGKDWDLARTHGGVKIIPPYMNAFANNGKVPYSSRLEALKSISNTIYNLTCDYVVLSDSDIICNVDIAEMVKQHQQTGADLTVAVKRFHVDPSFSRSAVLIGSDENGRMTDALAHPEEVEGDFDVNINILVFSRSYLQGIVREAIARGYTSLTKDVLARNAVYNDFRVYRYEGYYGRIDSLMEYYARSMEMISDPEARDSLFRQKDRPIYTKVKNSPPTKYIPGSKVENSLIADGCVIEGTVENCILFRGVHVGKNTFVKDSIIFQDTIIGDNVFLNCVITDKNVVIRDARMLSGHKSMPFFIEKSKMI